MGAAGGQDFALGASISVNSIANTVDAHISNSTDNRANGDITVSASEAAGLYSVAGGIGVALGGSAVGAALAYNYIGGSFNPANPSFIDRAFYPRITS